MVEIEESESAPPMYIADRRADGPGPDFIIPEGIRVAEQQIASGRSVIKKRAKRVSNLPKFRTFCVFAL